MKKALLVLTFMLFSHTASAAGLSVVDPWVRLMPPVTHATAAYMTLQNDTSANITVVAATCDAASKTGLHGTRRRNGEMVMYPLDSAVVPAHGRFSFTPGHAHIMLMGLHNALKVGQKLDIVLHLADGGSLRVSAPVRDMRMGK